MTDIELNDGDRAILDELRNGRNVPQNIANNTEYSRVYISKRLKRLREHGIVENIGGGVYELVNDPRETSRDGGRTESRPIRHDDTETGHDATQGVTTEADETEAPRVTGVDDLLEDWRPGQSAKKRHAMRDAGRAALVFLQGDGGPLTASDFKRELYTDHSNGVGQDGWWRKWVRPALQLAQEADVVDYSHGRHEYRWAGDSE